MKIEVFSEYRDFNRVIDFYILRTNDNGDIYICKSMGHLVFEPYKDTDLLPDPSLSVYSGMAQPLIRAFNKSLDILGVNPLSDKQDQIRDST